LLERVREYILKEKMLAPGDRVIVATSGGMDSVVLLDLLYNLRFFFEIELLVVHFHHHVRPYGCERDALFVEELAKALSLPFIMGSGDIPFIAGRERKSLEEAGRDGRYDFFRKLLRQGAGNKVATAHTEDDSVETVLMRFLRGAGARGLSGIPSVREGTFIRPLLNCERKDIRLYAIEKDLCYIDDQTNRDLYFMRNRIRHSLIPLLKKDFNPGLTRNILRLSHICTLEEDYMASMTEEDFEKSVLHHTEDIIILDLKSFCGCHKALQRRLVRLSILKLSEDAGEISYENIMSILKIARGETGRIFRFRNILVRKEYDRLIFSLAPHLFSEISYEKELVFPGETECDFFGIRVRVSLKDFEGIPGGRDKFYAEFDASKLLPPLFLRNRRKGDRFVPLGMTGKKKLKDFFMDEKIPSAERDRIPLIVTSTDIAWVAGIRQDNRFRLTVSTEKVVSIEIQKLNL